MTPISPNEFFVAADYKRQSWHVVVPNDTKLDDILKPAFWVNVASQCKPYALIDVVTQDGLLDVQLRVVKVVPGMIVVRPRMIYEDRAARRHLYETAEEEVGTNDAADRAAPDGYKVGWNPGKKLYYVQLKATGTKLKEDCQTRVEALTFAEAHARALNTPVTSLARTG